ncbi:hypothetical protein ABH908_000118 [Pseudomonas frederiksbergensis]|uniref:hypothetical protein n=1 Tax=Pseudomonas TaxID=286 RepID=UPI003D1CE745
MNSHPHQHSAPTVTLPVVAVSPITDHTSEDATGDAAYAFKGFPYDMEDIGLNAVELQAKYAETESGEHDFHSRADWEAAVAVSGTKPDYWDWLLTMIAIDDEAY